MDPTHSFRKALLRRVLDIVGVTVLAGPVLEAGCGRVVVDLDGAEGTGGTGGLGGTSSISGTASGALDGGCFITPTATVSSGTGQAIVKVTECIDPLPQGCPSQYDAAQYILPTGCAYLVSVDCGPVPSAGQCCYVTEEQLNTCPSPGRPFLVVGELRTASWVDVEGGWSEADLAPSLGGLDEAARASLAAAWTRDALVEHASIASFGRFALDLMAVGAPADLVAQAHRAALDEVRHARLCFGLAQGYSGEPRAPSSFPFGGHVEIRADLASVAAATAREGCLGETLASLMAAEQLAHATDPAVRRVLAVIAADEARHAELAWRTVAWALGRGGPTVREAVLEVFGNAARHLPFGTHAVTDLGPAIAAAHGRLGARHARQAMVRAIAEVILPGGNALLSSRIEDIPTARPARSARNPLATDPSPVTRRSPS